MVVIVFIAVPYEVCVEGLRNFRTVTVFSFGVYVVISCLDFEYENKNKSTAACGTSLKIQCPSEALGRFEAGGR